MEPTAILFIAFFGLRLLKRSQFLSRIKRAKTAWLFYYLENQHMVSETEQSEKLKIMSQKYQKMQTTDEWLIYIEKSVQDHHRYQKELTAWNSRSIWNGKYPEKIPSEVWMKWFTTDDLKTKMSIKENFMYCKSVDRDGNITFDEITAFCVNRSASSTRAENIKTFASCSSLLSIFSHLTN
jgi:hypothetical protein